MSAERRAQRPTIGPQGAAMSRNGRVELRNGRIVDVEAGRFVDGAVRLIVSDGVIAAMPGLRGEAGPEADLIVDLGGRTVVPALVNTHTHLIMPVPGVAMGPLELMLASRHGRAQVGFSLEDCLDRGIATVRDTWCEDLRTIDRIERRRGRGEQRAPKIVRSVMVAQPGGTFSTRRGTATRLSHRAVGLPFADFDDRASGVLVFPRHASPRAVREAVDRAIDERGAQTIKAYDQRERYLSYKPGATIMTQAQLDALVDQARRRGVPVTIHHLSVESFRRGLRAGVTSLAHLPVDGPLSDEDVRAFEASATMIEPTITLAFFYSFAHGRPLARSSVLDDLRDRALEPSVEAHWLAPLRPVVRRSLEKAARGSTRMVGVVDLSNVYTFFSRYASHGIDNLRRLHEAAGPSRIACGNDAGACAATPAGIGLELEMLRLFLGEERSARPFDAADALRCATITAARALGLDGQIGSIRTGKRADLAVLDGDPLSDPSILGRPVAALFLDGALVSNRCGLVAQSPGREGHRMSAAAVSAPRSA